MSLQPRFWNSSEQVIVRRSPVCGKLAFKRCWLGPQRRCQSVPNTGPDATRAGRLCRASGGVIGPNSPDIGLEASFTAKQPWNLVGFLR